MKREGRVYLVFQISAAAWLFGWFLKYKFFGPYFSNLIFTYPVFTDQFPPFFQNPNVAFTAYHMPVLCILGIFTQKRFVYIGMSLLMLICTIILGLHIDTYNDMTFISSFWVALWLLWYSFHIDDQRHIKAHAPLIAKCIIALLFLGGTVGKLTPEYWSGEAFYNLVVHQTPGYAGIYLRNTFTIENQKLILGVLSKMIIMAEGLMILSPLYPYRIFCVFGVCVIFMLVLFREWQIFSVLSCLAGITLSCLLLIDGTKSKHKLAKNAQRY